MPEEIKVEDRTLIRQSSFQSDSSLTSSTSSSKLCKSPTLILETERNLRESRSRLPILSLLLFKDGYSLHHKVSQSNLKECFKEWLKHGSPEGFFKQAISVCEKCSEAQGLQALLNAPFNVELGPLANLRKGDPGSGFDPNCYSDGDLTPRSKSMHVIFSKKQRKKPRPQYEIIGEAFVDAYRVHTQDMRLSEKEMSSPELAQWSGGSRWERAGRK